MELFDFFLALITIFTGTALPLARKWKNDFCNKLDNYQRRLELLEFIAMREHPEHVADYNKIQELKK